MTTAWASETFEFGGDLVRLTGRGIKEAEYFARVANGCTASSRRRFSKQCEP
jgi:hypothetical protein